jgi:hypothetical protein
LDVILSHRYLVMWSRDRIFDPQIRSSVR